MICGIYMIQNKVNGKIYIGQAVDIEGSRWKKHKSELRGNYHGNEHLQRDWNKYGEESVEFSILLECEENQLNTYEEYYIFELMAYDNRVGYNKNYGGYRGRPTEETRKKMSEAKKGEKCHMYGRTGENHPMYGNNPNGKLVVQINLNTNEIVKVWKCTREAERQGFCHSNISACCRGKRKSHKGYKWMYLEDYNKLNKKN